MVGKGGKKDEAKNKKQKEELKKKREKQKSRTPLARI